MTVDLIPRSMIVAVLIQRHKRMQMIRHQYISSAPNATLRPVFRKLD